jgi:ADP-ribose pyrophosphatase
MTSRGTFILARQYRPGPDRIVDELPGGRCNSEEPAEEAARRELLEETGFEAEEWICLGTFLECAYSTVERWGFVALNVRPTTRIVDELEPVAVVEKNLSELVQQLRDGLICDPEVAWAGIFLLNLVTVSPTSAQLPNSGAQ